MRRITWAVSRTYLDADARLVTPAHRWASPVTGEPGEEIYRCDVLGIPNCD